MNHGVEPMTLFPGAARATHPDAARATPPHAARGTHIDAERGAHIHATRPAHNTHTARAARPGIWRAAAVAAIVTLTRCTHAAPPPPGTGGGAGAPTQGTFAGLPRPPPGQPRASRRAARQRALEGAAGRRHQASLRLHHALLPRSHVAGALQRRP